MAKLYKPGEGGSGKPGVFIQKAKISNISVNSYGGSSKYPKDVDVVLDLEFNKNVEEGEAPETYAKKMFLGGNLYKKGKNKGALAINLTYFLYAVGIGDLPEKEFDTVVDNFAVNDISKAVKDLVIGKSISTLQFVSGTYNKDGEDKPSYKFWNMQGEGFSFPNCFSIATEEEVIIKTFEEKCDGQYAPPYTPEVIKELEALKDGGADGSVTEDEDFMDEKNEEEDL